MLLVVSWHYGLYGPLQLRTMLHEQRMTAQACLTAGLLLSGGLYLTEGYHVSRSLVLFLVCFHGGDPLRPPADWPEPSPTASTSVG